jgi:hypothetical protein
MAEIPVFAAEVVVFAPEQTRFLPEPPQTTPRVASVKNVGENMYLDEVRVYRQGYCGRRPEGGCLLNFMDGGAMHARYNLGTRAGGGPPAGRSVNPSRRRHAV